MESREIKYEPTIPRLDLSEGREMLTDFSREAQRHLLSAKNSMIILETMSSDQEALENIFKTFHTIKGLADFLHLQDIFNLTSAVETMIDMVRKSILRFDAPIIELTLKSIAQLQKLLELLDEQISNDGNLKSGYPDIGDLVIQIKSLTSQKMIPQKSMKSTATTIPTIHFEPNRTACEHLENLALSAQAGECISIPKEEIDKLINDYKETINELKDVQGKLKERQRELIHERELAIKLTRQAQAEAHAKSEYLANVSHEIRTLINAILGFTEILRTGVLTNKQKEHLNTIILSGKMLLGIVNDILDFSKVEAGKLKFESIDFDLVNIIEEVFKIIRTRLLEKPINLYYDIDESVPRHLIGDPTRLKQVFINLLDNAIKFTEKGEVGMEVTPLESSNLLADKRAIRFVIRDTGIGIPEEHKKSIFESFAQAGPSTARLYGGSGLGLALCKTFIETMGGVIQVESILGQGSQFTFTIKLPEGKAAKFRDQDSSPLRNFAGTSIMVVDQFPHSAKVLSQVCQKNGIKVLPITHNAKQATELLIEREKHSESLPHIIFIDTLLPNKEGFMLAYKIRHQEQYKDIKLCAISANVKIDMTSDFRQAGFDMFLPKPVIPSELINLFLYFYGDNLPEHRIIMQDMLEKISCADIRILVVEDSIPNQELLKVHLENLGCASDFASNGKEAIALLQSQHYDLCLMDLHMPILDGYQATKIIRDELKLDVPIIALTAAEVQEEKDKCLQIGMDDYLPKPFGIDDLKKKIIKCIKM